MKIKKILVIATTRFELDGITNVIMNYYRNMDKSNIHFDFLVSKGISNALLKEIQDDNKGEVFQLPNRMKKPLKYSKELLKVLQKEKYDVVHAHGNSGTLFIEMFIAKLCGTPIRIAHSHNSTSNYKTLHYFLKPFMKACTTHSFACSSRAGDWLFGKNYLVLNNGIELNNFSFNQEKRELYRNKYNLHGRKVYGHIGHFSFQKNHDFLIEIFSEIYKRDKNSVLILIGDGKLKKEMENKADNLGLKDAVIFTGRTLEAPNILQAIDIIVFPSHFEGLPLTLVEAQASGLPSLVSKNVSSECKLTDLIEFFSLSNPSEIWAEKILSMKSDFSLRKKQSDIAVKQLIDKGYSIEGNVKVLQGIYFSNNK